MRESILRKLRSTDSATGTFDLRTGIDRAVNDAISEVTQDGWYEWTIREFWFNTIPPVVSTATQAVSVQAGSDHITGSGAVFVAAMSGRIILIDGGKLPYELLTVSAGVDTARLVVGFEGTTNKTAAPFRILAESFVLDQRVRKRRKMVLESGTSRWPMVYVPPRIWDRAYPRVVHENRPYYYTVIRYTADGLQRIKLWPIPDTRYVIRFSAYTFLPELVNNADQVEMPGTATRVVEDVAYARVLTEHLHITGQEVALAMAKAENGKMKLRAESLSEPDFDMERGVAPYPISGLPVALYPPSFGFPVEV